MSMRIVQFELEKMEIMAERMRLTHQLTAGRHENRVAFESAVSGRFHEWAEEPDSIFASMASD